MSEPVDAARALFDRIDAAAPPPVAEGSPCPTCKRRVPYKKKATSPQTEVFSTRIPIGDKDDFSEMIDAAAAHRGLSDKPHHRYWTLLQGLVSLLQGPSGGEED